jgi:hypothetical protein
MKINNRLLLIGLLITGIVSMHCSGDNPVIDLNDPSTFPGTYKIVSFTDLTGEDYGQAGLTITAGKPTTITMQEGDISISMILTISGTLTLTDKRYTVSQTMTMSLGGFGEETQTETDTGTYTIEGSTITIVSDDETEDTQVGTISVGKSDMTIEFEDMKIVLEKQ